MQHPNEVRGPIESDHNKQRDEREKKYTEDRLELEEQYHQDLRDIQQAKQDALVSAGLNPDGGVPVVDNRERVAVEDDRADAKEDEEPKEDKEQVNQ